MQMSDAAAITEVHGQVEANKHLQNGWKLLAVFPATATGGMGATTYGVYVMAKAALKKDPMEGFALGGHT